MLSVAALLITGSGWAWVALVAVCVFGAGTFAAWQHADQRQARTAQLG
jgi:hypothetical protein